MGRKGKEEDRMSNPTYQETANGRAYTYAGVTVLFRVSVGYAYKALDRTRS